MLVPALQRPAARLLLAHFHYLILTSSQLDKSEVFIFFEIMEVIVLFFYSPLSV